MRQVFTAQLPQANVRPAFTVTKLEGTVPHKVHLFDKKTNKIVSKTVEEPAGFMVKFAKGHSIRCKSVDHLKQIGLGYNLVPLINTETGDVMGAVDNIDAVLDEAAA